MKSRLIVGEGSHLGGKATILKEVFSGQITSTIYY